MTTAIVKKMAAARIMQPSEVATASPSLQSSFPMSFIVDLFHLLIPRIISKDLGCGNFSRLIFCCCRPEEIEELLFVVGKHHFVLLLDFD